MFIHICLNMIVSEYVQDGVYASVPMSLYDMYVRVYICMYECWCNM